MDKVHFHAGKQTNNRFDSYSGKPYLNPCQCSGKHYQFIDEMENRFLLLFCLDVATIIHWERTPKKGREMVADWPSSLDHNHATTTMGHPINILVRRLTGECAHR